MMERPHTRTLTHLTYYTLLHLHHEIYHTFIRSHVHTLSRLFENKKRKLCEGVNVRICKRVSV
jgi:hypothetical protein